MKKRKYMCTMMVLLLTCWMSVGCVNLNFDDYEKYAQAHVIHSQMESQRIEAQANAIRETVLSAGSTPTERLLLAIIGALQIKDLKPNDSKVQKPTTGMDVLSSITGHLPFGILGLSNYMIAKQGIQSAGSVHVNGENIEMKDSLNDTEVHATGDSNTASAPNKETTTTETRINE